MARRVLSSRLAFGLAYAALTVCACRHSDPSPTREAAPAASASASHYADQARESHLRAELTRAWAYWRSKPALADCGAALHEKEDLELCQEANSALERLEQAPEAAAESALPALENTALALARLSKRMRYLSIGELSKKRLAGDAGASTPVVAPSAQHAPPRRQMEHGHPSFELGDGPISQLMDASVRMEREAVRQLGAYLEYAELPVRRSAFVTVKRLHEQHPGWPLLAQLLREAALLESDPELRGQLSLLSASAQPSGARPAQSADSK